jgi:hypothetical protein
LTLPINYYRFWVRDGSGGDEKAVFEAIAIAGDLLGRVTVISSEGIFGRPSAEIFLGIDFLDLGLIINQSKLRL